MPALGDNPNVMCYIDDIYIYLKARADGGLPRGRPPSALDKPAAAEYGQGLLTVASKRPSLGAGAGRRGLAGARARRGAQRVDLVNRSLARLRRPGQHAILERQGEGFENKIADIVADELKIPSSTPGSRRPRASSAIRCSPSAATWSSATPRATNWCSTPMPTTARPMRSSIARARGSTASTALPILAFRDKHVGIIAGTPPRPASWPSSA